MSQIQKDVTAAANNVATDVEKVAQKAEARAETTVKHNAGQVLKYGGILVAIAAVLVVALLKCHG